MDELFRFQSLRAPESVSAGAVIDLGTHSDFQVALAAAARESQARRTPGDRRSLPVIEVATAYLASAAFSADPGTLTFGTKLNALHERLVDHPSEGLDRLEALVKKLFDVGSAEVVADPRFDADEVRMKDALTAAYVSPKGHPLDMLGMASALRTAELVRALAIRDPALDTKEGVAAAGNRVLAVSPDVFPVGGDYVAPTGITQLLVVRQHIARYDRAEIEDVENIILGESRRKTVRDQIISQTTSTSESDTTTQVTKESDETERFALQNEVNKALQENLAIKAGASVSYKGGMVDASVNASVDYSQTKSESQKIATDFAREVVSKATTQVTTTVKQQLIRQFTETSETLEDHSFDNSKGDGHISAVYQWLNKIYVAQIYNYGVRTIYDLIVPEPALQWIVALAGFEPAAVPPSPKAPPDFDVDAGQITTANFETLAAKYRASGVPAPPSAHAISAATAAMTKDATTTDAMVAVKVPDGYVARGGEIGCQYDWKATPNSLEVLLGETNVTFGQNEAPRTVNFAMDGTGDIPCTIHAYNVSNYSVSIRVESDLLPEKLQEWQEQVFDKLLAGWESWQSDYQDALSKRAQALEAAGDRTLGGNPDDNRAVERTELKRSFLQLLVGNFQLSAIDTPDDFPHPTPGLALQQGEFVRFLEHAFEWEQMSYVLYPYFWADHGRWVEKLRLSAKDPLFEKFLRAGSARVVVSVRLGFEGALDYFLRFGVLWAGGGPPTVTSAYFVPIWKEIQEETAAPGAETPYGDPWEVAVPTSLVRVRKDDKLPTWKQPDPTKWVWVDDAPTD